MLSEIIQSEEALLSIKPEWQALTAATAPSTDFFATWDFVWHYITVFKPSQWLVVALRDEATQQLNAVFAWSVFNLQTEGALFRAVQPLGSSLIPYVEYPVDSRHLRPVLQTLLTAVLRERAGVDVVCLWPLHEASPLYNALLEDLRGSDALKTFRYPGNLCEIETRGQDYTRYSQSKASSTFANARYCERRLQKEGKVRFTLCEPPEQAKGIVEQLCAASEQRFGEHFAYRHKPQWATFVSEIASALGECGVAQVSTLRLDERIIAAGLSYWHKGRRYFYLFHYEPAYSQYSPGKILMHRLIVQTFVDKGVFCFGSGIYQYKVDWAQSIGELKAAYIFLNPEARHAMGDTLNGDFIQRLGWV